MTSSGSICLCLIGLLAGAAPFVAQAAGCQLALGGTLPLHPIAGGAAVSIDAKAGGANLSLVVDTGNEGLLLTEAAAARANSSVEIGSRIGGTGEIGLGYVRGVGGARVTRELQIDNLHLGRARGDFLAMVTSETMEEYGVPVDGLLGMSVLANFDIDFDFWGHEMRLFRTAGTCTHPAVALDQPIYAVPLAGGYHDAVHPIVDVVINGQPFRALLDSGAASIVLFGNAAGRLNITDPDPKASNQSIGVGGKARIERVRLQTLSVGPITLRNVAVGVDRENLGNGVDMLLGMPFMQKVHVWLSNSSRTLVMQYPPAASPSITP